MQTPATTRVYRYDSLTGGAICWVINWCITVTV